MIRKQRQNRKRWHYKWIV